MPYRGEYQFLTKEQLEKLTTKRLLNINRTLILGRMLDPDDGTVACGFTPESTAQKYREAAFFFGAGFTITPSRNDAKPYQSFALNVSKTQCRATAT